MHTQKLRVEIEQQLGRKIQRFSLLGKGMCNNAWLVLAEDQQRYVIKEEKAEKQEEEENDLLVEAEIIVKLNEKLPELPIPQVVFINENPKMYGYEYAKGELMKIAWNSLTEGQRNEVCIGLASFHANLINALNMGEIEELQLSVNLSDEEDEDAVEDLKLFQADVELAENYKEMAKLCYEIVQATASQAILGLCHNDSHHENILIQEGQLSCVIDFGDADFGDIHREFTRYFQDYPGYADLIIQNFEKQSGKKLSKKRILALTVLDALEELRSDFKEFGHVDWFEQFWPFLC